MTEWLKAFFQESNGDSSSMRMLVAFIVVVQMLGWAWVVYKNPTSLPAIDWQQIGLVVGPLFMKAYQKGKEAPAQ